MTLLIVAMFYNRKSKVRFRLNTVGLIVSTTFLLCTLINKKIMTNSFTNEVARQNIPIKSIEVRPAPLQNILWTGNVETEGGYYIGYRSFFDNTSMIPFSYFEKKHSLLTPYLHIEKLQKLLFITKGWYTVTQINSNNFMINDLRFGLVDGIAKSNDRFVFAYKMTVHQDDSLSFEKEQYKFGKDVGQDAFKTLWGRIKGL